MKKFLIKNNFLFVKKEDSPFNEYPMAYYVKDCFILFFNENENYSDQFFLMGFGEQRMGNYNVVSFRWTNDLEVVKKVYNALTCKTLTE